ncbi:competence protein ComEA [Lachnospiraceae bacterium XBB1006]|nr:competence protein ComEA [Lachnospiraceae bacterium XBB1006]
MKRIQYWIIGVMLCLLLAGCGRENDVEKAFLTQPEESAKEETEVETSTWYVQIDGAVKKPGVYPVSENTRVFEVIKQAGGVTKQGCLDGVNQAAKVTDAQQIHICTRKEMRKSRESKPKSSAEEGKVNLNEADKQTLVTLPGIGDAKADLILTYREQNGKFSSIEDIMKIQGIKEGVFRKIKDLICV